MVRHHPSYCRQPGLLALQFQLKLQFVALQDVSIYLAIFYFQLLRTPFFHCIDHDHHPDALRIELMKFESMGILIHAAYMHRIYPPFLGEVGEGDNMKCQQNEKMYEYSIIIPVNIPHRKSDILAPYKYSV